MTTSIYTKLLVFLCCLVAAPSSRAQTGYKPQTSTHASFKPADFERIAVIVKPVQEQARFGGMGRMGGNQQQGQVDRLVEQKFMRVLLGSGYTLVSRMDLDAALKEQGLDASGLTDESMAAKAGKILHVPAIMVVSVDAFKTSPMTRQGPQHQPGTPGFAGYGNNSTTYYQVVATVGARLVKISDNMVMWAGDLSVTQNIPNQDQDTDILGNVAEAIAKGFPKMEK